MKIKGGGPEACVAVAGVEGLEGMSQAQVHAGGGQARGQVAASAVAVEGQE